MASYQGEIFDADNHFYEAHDAFIRHVPKRMRSRCVEWVELEDGRRYQMVGGRIDRSGNPTFNPISRPGVLREYFSGNPRGLTSAELIRSALEPMPQPAPLCPLARAGAVLSSVVGPLPQATPSRPRSALPLGR